MDPFNKFNANKEDTLELNSDTSKVPDHVSNYKNLPSRKLNVTVWNIHGLSDKLGDTDIQDYIKQFHIVALTETKKCKKYQPSYPGYIAEHYARSKSHEKARSASAGCLILIKKGYENLVEILPPTNEHIIWLKIKNPASINHRRPHLLGIVYTSPEGSTYKPEHDFFTCLQHDITEKSAIGEISLVGDFNSRTGLLVDTLEESDDPTGFYTPAIKLPRYNSDTKTNKYGRELIKVCIHNGLQIINGRDLFNEYTGGFTYYGPNGNSAPDLLLCNHTSIKQISDFKLLPRSISSDHVPLSITFDINVKSNKCSDIPKKGNKPFKYIWDVNKKR